MARAGIALGATATLLAAVDLAHKASVGAENFHDRSHGYVALVLSLAALWTAAIVAARSVPLALGGGIVAGGALGNLLSLALWPGVPNPIVVELIAFNLADVFVLVGFVFVAAVVLILAATKPDRLRESVSLRP
jgi:lipoprotein signal peptidase